jgi:hypothetical protein
LRELREEGQKNKIKQNNCKIFFFLEPLNLFLNKTYNSSERLLAEAAKVERGDEAGRLRRHACKNGLEAEAGRVDGCE